MFIVVTNREYDETVNLSQFSVWFFMKNQSETYTVFAHTRGRDMEADDSKQMLGDYVALGVYPTEAAAESAKEELDQAIMDGKKGFVMP